MATTLSIRARDGSGFVPIRYKAGDPIPSWVWYFPTLCLSSKFYISRTDTVLGVQLSSLTEKASFCELVCAANLVSSQNCSGKHEYHNKVAWLDCPTSLTGHPHGHPTLPPIPPTSRSPTALCRPSSFRSCTSATLSPNSTPFWRKRRSALFWVIPPPPSGLKILGKKVH